MQFHFPDSGKDIEIEGVSFLTLSLLRGWFDKNYPNKPVEPIDPLEADNDGNVSSPEFKAKYEQFKKDKEKYTQDSAIWQIKANQAKWAAVKMYYARSVVEESIDKEAIAIAIQQVQPFMNLPQEIVDGYKELDVPFDIDLLDKYIYLFHVCITTSGDQTLFENELMQGSGPTQEAVQQAFFRLRS